MHRALPRGWCLSCGHRFPHHGRRGTARKDPSNLNPTSQLPMPGRPGAWALGLPTSKIHHLRKACV